ncbi:bifunctional GNAT family N-acetyltransferase/carbon-nitrogen hydrolase family protein [Puniceicoccus vermicola]|uniref:GNAT family N-acetyltransferase n=1 Tax=Puniceicoccus vermicola TaxID=388746 RepID=A0A7X1B346_9BACT|nr:bifunctional GNAT family N-acetyltransferase/carbon-nitrogen hydrolase family protein [Puniceicoccus vermicola]MBC2603540.1 GNAT family N-acetyltransferase [Puniceicoccus vermicola]
MILQRHETPDGLLVVRNAELRDISELIKVCCQVYPGFAAAGFMWSEEQLKVHQTVFPDGQILAEINGKIVGAVASLIVEMGSNPYRQHTYAGITDAGYFHNHNPQGDTLYGAEVFVHPDHQGKGIGGFLYQSRRDLCQKLNLRRILGGGRLSGYSKFSDKLTPEEYVREVEEGDRKDPVLSFQMREGFVVRGILRNYMDDPGSCNAATLIEWLNPDFKPVDGEGTKMRVSCVQYQVRSVETFEDFAAQVEYFVETAADYRSDMVVFPEFFSVQLLSQKGMRRLPSLEGIRKLAEMEKPFMDLMVSLAKDYGLHIVAGSHPMERDGVLYNMSPIIYPDGTYDLQPKIHITPAEKRYWGISGGSTLQVFQTNKAKVGILICYDSEFPEAARYLADQGAEVLIVPYCTDDRQAYLRVRYCSQARAIENQVYVVTSGIIGNLPSVPAMDIHYGQAAVFSPSDFEFARDGIQAQADSNVEMLLVTDLDIGDLYRSRAAGSVTPRLDRRLDLFEFRSRFGLES